MAALREQQQLLCSARAVVGLSAKAAAKGGGGEVNAILTVAESRAGSEKACALTVAAQQHKLRKGLEQPAAAEEVAASRQS